LTNFRRPFSTMNLTASIDSKLVKEIVKSYKTLDYTPKLRELVHLVFPKNNINKLCKLDLHRTINDVVVEGYEGEQILKYRLFKAFQHANLVAAFEIKVKNSRVDFLTINGHTTSYEIKSNLDNLYKLAKQSGDYLGAFEFNNIVIHKRHLEKCYDLIPVGFGIITANKSEHSFIRKPVFNRSLNPEKQLSLLTKKEIVKCFGTTEVPVILSSFPAVEVNHLFKAALKERYRSRWDFIVTHGDDILPIDLQFFFNKNVAPSFVYG
jgi:hypothetical protein